MTEAPSIQEEMPKAYEPNKVEQKWYQFWLGKEYFKAEIDPERRRWAIVIICITIGACLALFASTLWPNVPGMSVFTVLIIVMGGFLGRRLARYMEEREEAGEQRSKARRDLATWEDLKLTLRAFWTVIVVAAVVVWLAGRWAGPHLPIPDEWKRVFGWVIEGDGVQTDSELDAEGGE